MSTEITYTRQGDYNLPNFTLPKQDTREIGIWGARRRQYLKKHHKILYYNLLTSCKLHDHLADINEEATEMYEQLVEKFAKAENITEQLKAENQMLWVAKMNNVYNRAQEIVNIEMIHK